MPDDKFLYKMSFDDIRAYQSYRRDRDVLDEKGPPKSDYQDPHMKLALEYLTGKIKPAEKPAEEKTSETAKATE